MAVTHFTALTPSRYSRKADMIGIRFISVLALFADEAVALMASDVLGNKEFIKRFTKSQRSWAQRFLSKIIEVKEAFGRVTDSNARKEYRRFVKAEQIWKEALNELGARYVAGKIMMNGTEDDDADIDVDSEMSYNENASAPQESRKYANQSLNSITQQAYNHHAWATNELTGVLSAEEIGQFNDIIGQIKNGTYTPRRTTDGKYLVEVGEYKNGERCTIILTDGKFNGPSIDAVYKVNTDSVELTNYIKEFIYGRASTAVEIGTMEESWSSYAHVDDNESFREYTLKSGRSFAEFARQRADSRENSASPQTEQNGRGDNQSTRNNKGIKFSLKGTTQDGIEIYETSEEIRALSDAEKRKLFVRQMRNEYRGRTAKFTVNGKVYYASFAHEDINKLAYGDKRSDKQGRAAKLNIEADGDIFDLTSDARYYASTDERDGKSGIAHNGVTSWDYFVKTVEVDNAVYDVVINVRESNGNKFVYDISMRKNKKITPSLSMSSTESALVSNEEVTSVNSIRKNSKNVNTSNQKNAKFSRKDAEGNKTHYRKSDIGAILDAVASDIVAEHTKNTLIHLYDFENNYSTTRR